MITFTIEIVGETETRYTSLTASSKTVLKDLIQKLVADNITFILEDQEKKQDVSNDVSITVE